MATAKAKNEKPETENEKPETENEKPETVNETPEATVDPGEELVEYFAPIVPGDNRQDIFVGVNGETLVIKRGVKVKIKRKFYEVLMNAEAQERSAYRAMEEAKRQSEKALASM